MLSLSDAQGVNKNTSVTFLSCWVLSVHPRFADLIQCNVPHQVYVIYVKDPDQQVIKIEGMVVDDNEGCQPNTHIQSKLCGRKL